MKAVGHFNVSRSSFDHPMLFGDDRPYSAFEAWLWLISNAAWRPMQVLVRNGRATELISDGQEVTVSCAEGDTGFVYEGLLAFEQQCIELDAMPPAPVRIMMNVGNPDRAFAFAALPHRGIVNNNE